MVDKHGSGGAIRRSFYFLHQIIFVLKKVMAHSADLRTVRLAFRRHLVPAGIAAVMGGFSPCAS
jgi:hypothetical protein